MHEKGQKGEENSDVISPKQLLCFLVTLANKPCMNGGERGWVGVGGGWGARNTSAPQEGKDKPAQATADSQERPDTGGRTCKQHNRRALASANEAERGKVDRAAAPAAI